MDGWLSEYMEQNMHEKRAKRWKSGRAGISSRNVSSKIEMICVSRWYRIDKIVPYHSWSHLTRRFKVVLFVVAVVVMRTVADASSHMRKQKQNGTETKSYPFMWTWAGEWWSRRRWSAVDQETVEGKDETMNQ